MTFQGCFLPSFDSFSQAVSEEKIFKKSTNHKEEWFVGSINGRSSINIPKFVPIH
jgi:hypothetical protein